jgi:hypothetical protein
VIRITTSVQPLGCPLITSRLVFVSSQTYNGNLGGVPGADAQCTSLARQAGMHGIFKAWVSSSASNPLASFYKSLVPYRLPDGTLVANSWADLISTFYGGHLSHPIDQTENKVSLAATPIWTQTWENGSLISSIGTDACQDWTISAISNTAATGLTSLTDKWSSNDIAGLYSCNLLLRLYCFQQ